MEILRHLRPMEKVKFLLKKTHIIRNNKIRKGSGAFKINGDGDKDV